MAWFILLINLFKDATTGHLAMSHYEERLERDLLDIREQVAKMAALVETATKNAMHALQTGNDKLASATVLEDHVINRTMRRIDQLCHKFIALCMIKVI